MNTPPLLILATLAFWGWQTGHLVYGILAGCLLESSRLIKARWSLTQADFNRLFNICIVLFIGVGAFLAGAEVLSQFAVFFVMLASIRFVGIPNSQVTLVEALAVFAFVRLASAMPIIPGNVGLAELGYIGGIHLAGAAVTPATAAVLLFRFLTYFLQIPLGGLTYLVWRRKTGWRVPSAALAPDQQDAVQAAR